LQNFIFYKIVENCRGGSGYSAETQGRLGFKGLSKLGINQILLRVFRLGYNVARSSLNTGLHN